MRITFAEHHPYIFTALMEVAVFVAYTIAGIIVRSGKLDLLVLIVANGLLAILIVTLLTKWTWWRRAGFEAPRHRRDLLYYLILLIPVALNVIPSRIVGNPDDLLRTLANAYGNPRYLLLALVATLLVGFAEEGIFRGLMFQAILPRGVWKAVIITSLLFGLTHSANLLHGQSVVVTTIQILYALAIGFVAAALVATKGLIWPLVVAHFLTDFTGLPSPAASVTVHGVLVEAGMVIIFIVFGIYLLLRHRLAQPVDSSTEQFAKPTRAAGVAVK